MFLDFILQISIPNKAVCGRMRGADPSRSSFGADYKPRVRHPDGVRATYVPLSKEERRAGEKARKTQGQLSALEMWRLKGNVDEKKAMPSSSVARGVPPGPLAHACPTRCRLHMIQPCLAGSSGSKRTLLAWSHTGHQTQGFRGCPRRRYVYCRRP